MVTTHITQSELRDVLDYNPDTGVFTWKKQLAYKWKIGTVAGNVKSNGYRRVVIHGKKYFAHRLAYFYVYGMIPKFIDHINGIRDDNRISNLRAATKEDNCANSGIRSDNKSGYKGVRWSPQKNKWVTTITKHGVRKHLGFFDSPEEAYKVYLAHAVFLNGEYARG